MASRESSNDTRILDQGLPTQGTANAFDEDDVNMTAVNCLRRIKRIGVQRLPRRRRDDKSYNLRGPKLSAALAGSVCGIGAMQLLGVFPSMYRELVDRMDAMYPSPRLGRPAKIANKDEVALVLRWARCASAQWLLQARFGAGRSDLSRHLRLGRTKLLAVLREMPDARVTYPSLKDGEEMEQHMEKVFPYPVPAQHPRTFLIMDGTLTPGKRHRTSFVKGLYKQHDRTLNHLMLVSMQGLVVDFGLPLPGASHDTRAAEDIFSRIDDPSQNSSLFGVLADASFNKWHNNGDNGKPIIFTQPSPDEPLTEPDASATEKEETEAIATWINVVRERTAHWFNDDFANKFPRLQTAPLLAAGDAERKECLELCVRLFNMLVRRGWPSVMRRMLYKKERDLRLEAEVIRSELVLREDDHGSEGDDSSYDSSGSSDR